MSYDLDVNVFEEQTMSELSEMRQELTDLSVRAGNLERKFDAMLSFMQTSFENINGLLDRVIAKLEEHDRRFDSIEKRLDSVESRLDAVEMRLEAVEMRLEAVEKRIESIEISYTKLKYKLQIVNESIQELRTDFHMFERRLNELEEDAS